MTNSRANPGRSQPHPMRRHGKSRVAVGLLFLLLLALLAGCSTEREHSFKVSQDWSRGIRLGITSFRQPVALAADEAGAYMVWPVKGEETTLLQYAHLGPDGLLLGSGPLDVDLIFPKLPRLVAGDNLHLFLVTRQTSAELPGAYGVVLNRDGQVLNDLARLSNPEQRVDHMAEVQSPQGEIHLLWDVIEGPGTGVYHAQVQPDGTLTGFPQLVWPGGIQPAATVAEDGTVHMAWMQQINPSRYNLYYASLAPGATLSSDPVVVAQPLIGTSDIASPPTVALDAGNTYILWSLDHRSGLAAGTAEIFSIAFPNEAPSMQVPLTVYVSSDPLPRYQEVAGYEPLRHLAFPTGAADWTGYLEGPNNLPWAGKAAAVLANMTYDFRVNPRSQPVLMLLENGEMTAHQQTSLTRQFSLHPIGAASRDGQLHSAWIDLEAPGEYSVYYASTRPAVIAALDARTTNDTFNDSMDMAWGMASGLTMLPLAIVTFVPVLMVAGIYYLAGQEGSLRSSRGARFALLVGIILYLTTKLILMGGLLSRPPFMNSIPPDLVNLWTYAVSLIIALIAGIATFIYARRAGRPELLKALLLFCATDAMLTMVLYGPTFFGE